MIHVTELNDRYVAEIHWSSDSDCLGEVDACMASMMGALSERFESTDDAKAIMMISCLKAVDGNVGVELMKEDNGDESIIEMLKEAMDKEGSC